MVVGFSRCLGTALLAVVLLSGCGEVSPIGRRPDSAQFLSQDRLAAMAAPGMSRDAIQQRFGEPYAVSQGGNAIAFLACETVDRKILTVAVVVPFWATSSITYFQVLGVWFDADGKVVRARLWNGHNGPNGGNPYASYSVPSRQQTLLWLDSPLP